MAERRRADRKSDRPGGVRKAPARSVDALRTQASHQTLRFTRKNWVLFGSGILAIVLGFGLLALGDITVAPFLLLGGYLVLIPWSLIARPKGREETGSSSPS